jgi:hypothetical protein
MAAASVAKRVKPANIITFVTGNANKLKVRLRGWRDWNERFR